MLYVHKMHIFFQERNDCVLIYILHLLVNYKIDWSCIYFFISNSLGENDVKSDGLDNRYMSGTKGHLLRNVSTAGNNYAQLSISVTYNYQHCITRPHQSGLVHSLWTRSRNETGCKVLFHVGWWNRLCNKEVSIILKIVRGNIEWNLTWWSDI